MRQRWLGIVALACVAALGVGAAFAGGAECHGKSAEATQAKGECTMTADECAKEMQKTMATRGWLGIEKDKSAEGVMTVSRVYPGSPAEQAGFQVGDRLVSINGIALNAENKDKTYGLLKKAKIGDSLTYVVSRGSESVTLNATLAKIPESVLAESISKHTQQDHAALKN